MTKFKNILTFILAMCLCVVLSGCSVAQIEIKEYSKGKEQCFLSEKNAAQFTYKEKSYTILKDTVSNDCIGNWIGYIRQFAIIDEAGGILTQEEIEAASFNTLNDLKKDFPSAKYIIPFLNVYAAPNDASYLIVEVNGEYHKAVSSDSVSEMDTALDFSNVDNNFDYDFEINSQDATTLVYGTKVYQVTSEIISSNQLGRYLNVLAEKVVFDIDTKQILAKDELNKIDWNGTSSQRRGVWFYKDVYEISEIAIDEAVAVNVNNQYYVAIAQ